MQISWQFSFVSRLNVIINSTSGKSFNIFHFNFTPNIS